MIKEKISNIAVKIFYIVFSIILAFTVYNCIFNNANIFIEYNVIIICIGVILLSAILLCIYNIFNKKKFKSKIFVISCMTILIIVQLIFAYFFAVKPSWDFGAVYDSAVSSVNNQLSIFDNEYFYKYTNNIPLAIVLKVVYEFFNIINIYKFNVIGILLNIVLIDIGVFFTYLIAKEIFNEKKAMFVLTLLCLMTPIITYVPIYYTDTVSIPFLVTAIYCIIKANNVNKNKNKIFLFSLAGILLCIGTMIKITVCIFLVAYIIGLILYSKNIIKQKYNLVMVVIFGILYILQGIYINGNFDREKLDEIKFPYTHWLMIGAQGNGGYNHDDVKYTETFKTEKEKVNANIDMIKTRIYDLYKSNRLIEFYTNKLVVTWGDGTYFAPEKLSRDPVNSTRLQEYVLADGKYKQYYLYFSQIMQITILLFILISLIRDIYSKENDMYRFSLSLAMFGIMLFLMIWETRSRYIVNYIPIFILLTTYGIDCIYNIRYKVILNKVSITNMLNSIQKVIKND